MPLSEKDVEEVLCGRSRGLLFHEIYEKLRETHQDLRKIDVREILSRLIRKGKVERVADYERRRMVFRIKSGCREGSQTSS